MRLSVKKATVDSVSRWLQKYLHTTNVLQYPEEEFSRFDFLVCGPVTPQLVPRTICGKLCCRRWSPGPSMAAMDGPPCRKWSPTIVNRFKVDKTAGGIPTERSDCLVKAPCTLVAMANGK